MNPSALIAEIVRQLPIFFALEAFLVLDPHCILSTSPLAFQEIDYAPY